MDRPAEYVEWMTPAYTFLPICLNVPNLVKRSENENLKSIPHLPPKTVKMSHNTQNKNIPVKNAETLMSKYISMCKTSGHEYLT